jgi:hypothetical protein
MNTSDNKIITLHHHDNLDEWDNFVDYSPQGNIFCRSWWLRCVWPGGFDILILKKSGEIVAGMPYSISHKYGYSSIRMPNLTQTLGVLLGKPSSNKYETNISNEMERIKLLVESIPKVKYFCMNFHYNFTNWLPFYWSNFKQTTRYTYLINDLSNLKEIEDSFSAKTRNTIKKALKLGITIVESENVDDFLALNRKTFARQGLKLPYSEDLVRRINQECANREARKIFLAKDADNKIHSALFVIFDKFSMYNLMQGGDPDLRDSGANSLAMWHSIRLAQKVTLKYDFEGSMVPNIESFVRSFGPIQTPYFQISKGDIPFYIKIANKIV